MKKLGKRNYEIIETVEAYGSGSCGEACLSICKDKLQVFNSAYSKLINIAQAV